MVITKNRTPAVSPAPGEQDEASWLARRIVLDAGLQAARLRQQALSRTATICEIAEREAETIWLQASAQAAAIREAAERETAAIQAAILKVSARPDEALCSGDEAAIATRPATRPAAKPAVRRKSRQARAMRKVAAAFVVLSLAGTTSGVVEIKLHGFSFFLFRNAGAGAGNSRDLDEDQGPGQPDAPRPHHQAASSGASR